MARSSHSSLPNPPPRGVHFKSPVDAEQNLRGLGWTGALVKGPDIPNSGQRTNAVVAQLPAPGSGVNLAGSITLSFAS